MKRLAVQGHMRREQARWSRVILGICVGLALARSANGATIVYEAQSLGGNSWEYTYTVTNDSLGAPLEEFTIYFDRTLYANLAVTATPPDWDSLVVQPDSGLPADGFMDSLALEVGIGIGASLGGFSVSFDFIGQGAPAQQNFDIVDPDTFAVLESGSTAAVPAPPAGLILLTALASLAGRLRRRQRIPAHV